MREKKEELAEKQIEFILKMLAIQAEVLRCVYDENKMKNKTGSVENALNRIDEKVKDYIGQYIGKKSDPS